MIKQRRVALGLSERALAMWVGVSDAYITQLETREHQPLAAGPNQLAKALKVTVGEILS